MTRIKIILLTLLLSSLSLCANASEASDSTSSRINPKEIIFEHLLDGYGWEVPFDHYHRIPLPVIVWASDGLHCFSSARVEHGHEYTDGNCTFVIAGDESKYRGKIVELKAGEEIRPWDFSITKNVCATFITVLLVGGIMLWLASFHRRNPFKAPRRGLGAVEGVFTFVYNGVIKPVLGPQARRFAPYLMTVFFFILTMNLLGLVVIFPGGANLTGNIAVTLVLSIYTFIATNLFANKHYWKEIFWPDVPLWLKFPLPIMPMIEIFGMFTKPAALTVRLFANMMGGHMIVITLTLLIFIFSAISPVAGGGATVISLFFSIFMLLIDVLVSFIQAYVFTMLSTIFIGLAHEHEEEHELHADKGNIEKEITDTLV
ncbi:MAG: F0F1 ATP synthase subunit A [Muribaculaceae bacterium]|nr:F0F1 ATP synthase subunit A [Muribaculaceae bacterium]